MKKSIKTVIIDDEKPARDLVRSYLEDYPDFTIIDECSNGFEAIKTIQEKKPDLIFLDIQMPKLTGFEMLELLDKKPVVIFSTAYDDFAIRAFEASAADYLLKPYPKSRFGEAIRKAEMFLKNRSDHSKAIDDIVDKHHDHTPPLERVVVKTGTNIIIIPVSKIIWLEAQNDYVMLHLLDNKYLKNKTMSFFEANLSSDTFVRVHRSHIVRVDMIKQIEPYSKESYQIVLKTGKMLPVSKTGHEKLKKLLQ